MKVIGLCGGSGSGKGIVSSLFAKCGIPAIDTDKVYREITSADGPCNQALALVFGSVIISDDGSLNRKELAKIVFSGEEADQRLENLNKIAHKFILDETRKRLETYEGEGKWAAIVDAPVLFESGFDSECDIIISVVADREIRLGRIMKRDNLDRAAAEARINSQLSDSEIISRSDFVIDNNSDLKSLEQQVERIAKSILNN